MHTYVSTLRAAEFLGVSRATILNMIRDGVLTSAYTGAPDGFVGRTGYRISMEELEDLKRNGMVDGRKRRWANKKKAGSPENEELKKTINELAACVKMLSDTIDKLREEPHYWSSSLFVRRE